mgnify:CR=1 FL=1
MRKKRKGIALLLLFVLLMLPGKVVFADGTSEEGIENEVSEGNGERFDTTSPWLSGTQDNSIYENTIDAGEEEQDISAKTPGRVEKYIAELIRNIASALISLLQDTIGASIDSIIYGRVGSGHPNSVNIYAFELRKGNPYGVTASVCYALLRGMMFIFLGVSFVFQLAKAAWSGQTAKSREEIKAILPTLLMKFCALMLMPYLLDVALYIRDVLLYGIKEVTGQMVTGGATLSLSKSFLMNAERSGTFVDAAMYLGTVVLTIYFVFLYVAVAIDMLVCFVSFPFVCVFHSRKKDLISGWVSTVFSNLMTPVIDAVLLLIPLLTSLMLSDVIRGVSVIQLVMCMLIIPARVRLKVLLGIQSNERNGFLGAMAVMTLARSLASRIKQGVGKIAEAVSDAGKGRMHGELAEVDREEEESLLSGGSGTKDRQETPAEDSGGQQADMESALPGEEDASAAGSMEADSGGLQPDDMDADIGGLQPDSMEVSFGEKDTGRDAGTPSGGREMSHSGLEATGNTKGDALREIDRQVDQSQSTLDGLRMERSALVQKDKQLKKQMLDCKRGTEEYKRLEKERPNVESQTADVDNKIAKESGKLNRLRGQSKELHAALGMRNTPTQFDEKRAEILRKRANIDNFEQPEFRGVLTNDQMRVLYRNRAIAKMVKAAAGTVGAVAGGAVAGSASMFLGGSGVAMAAAGGLQAGGSAGEVAVDLSVGAARVIRPAAAKVGKAAYHAADMAASAHLMAKIRPAAMQVPLDTGSPLPPQQADIPPAVETAETAADMPESSYEARDVRSRVVLDAQNVIARGMSPRGNARSGSMLRVLQQANIEVEREIAILREEGTALTEEVIRSKRISVQEDMLTEEFMAQLEYMSGYQKDTEEYAEAEKLIREKIGALLAERDKPLI